MPARRVWRYTNYALYLSTHACIHCAISLYLPRNEMGVERVVRPGPRRTRVVFIHGMGMDLRIWADPGAARVLGGKYPLSAVVGRNARQLRTSFSDLSGQGYPVLAWSQRRPAGPIAAAVEELKVVLDDWHDPHRPLAIIAHSRGGLVARKYLMDKRDIKGVLVTIATPHHGSSMARFGAALSPFASAVSLVIGGRKETAPSTPFRRVLAFLGGKGLRELLPESPFFAGLRDERCEGLRYFSIGGTDPHIITVHGVSVTAALRKALPERLIPDELKDGMGDGLVTARSARIPFADEHRDFPLNHLTLLFDADVRSTILSAVSALE